MQRNIEWRTIWKACVDASQKTILKDDKEINLYFPELYKEYGDDKMITLEKAITLECLGKDKEAQELYIQSADEEKGLPVSHWRNRAKYFTERHSVKVAEYDDYYCSQWDTFYNMHTYSYLHPHIRYLAISSVSRINNEPEMAVVIFRTCLEICLELYWDVMIDENDYFLGKKIDSIFKGKVENKIYAAIQLIVDEGNLAAHPFKKIKFKKGQNQEKKNAPNKADRTKEKPFEYKNKDIMSILRAFDLVMNFCNEKASHNGISILNKDLELI